ncbi:GIY-YIG nuclease family protein [Streptomyces sp. NPDC048417]|uniref:GIY-YIG nuclease family protein n=1 Tax=Streptomyces sp. NPDC048417 TaxID=3155387 RepID=UPI003446219F
MLKLVHNAPQSWLRNYLNKTPVPAWAPKGTGYVYVLEVTGPTSYVKVGATTQPRTRLDALGSDAHRLGSAVSRAWLSPAHPSHHSTEAQALRACRAHSPAAPPRGEYFPHLAFGVARSEAIKAVLGFHDTSRAMPSTPVAGLHKPLPQHVHRLLAPTPRDVWQRLKNRFAEGSCRTRFLRRGEPSPTAAPRETDPLLDELIRRFVQPPASMPDLTTRRHSRLQAAAHTAISDQSD